MVKWFIEKENKIPLYLQLKDLIKYYISTGAIKDNSQLPGVNELAEELNINFDTVRKAYKELEKEGLVSMKRGTGTFVKFHEAALQDMKAETILELPPLEATKILIRKFMRQNMELAEVKQTLNHAVSEVSREISKQYVIFSECNHHQIQEISKILEDYLLLKVKPVLIQDLEKEIQNKINSGSDLLAIVTTGFHMNEVSNIIGDRAIDVHLLVTNMSLKTRNELDAFGPKAQYGFICRDNKSIPFYTDLLKAELGKNINLRSSILEETSNVRSILESADVLLVTPPVYQELQKKAPSGLPVFNVFDRIDHMSLKMVKDNLFRKYHL